MSDVRKLLQDATVLTIKLRELGRAGRTLPPLFTAEELSEAASIVDALAIVAQAYERERQAPALPAGVVRSVRVMLTRSGHDALKWGAAGLRRLAKATSDTRNSIGLESIANVLELVATGEGDPLLIGGASPGNNGSKPS